MADDNEDEDGPKGFNAKIFQAKHVATKTLKGAGIGALAGGIGVAAITAASAGAFLLAIPYLGPALAVVGIAKGTAAAVVMGAGITGALWGAAIGGGAGAVAGISSADEAVTEEADRRMELEDRHEARQMRRDAIAEQRQHQHQVADAQAHAMGLTPNAPYRDAGGPELG